MLPYQLTLAAPPRGPSFGGSSVTAQLSWFLLAKGNAPEADAVVRFSSWASAAVCPPCPSRPTQRPSRLLEPSLLGSSWENLREQG